MWEEDAWVPDASGNRVRHGKVEKMKFELMHLLMKFMDVLNLYYRSEYN